MLLDASNTYSLSVDGRLAGGWCGGRSVKAAKVNVRKWLGLPEWRVENLLWEHLLRLHEQVAIAVDEVDHACVTVHELEMYI